MNNKNTWREEFDERFNFDCIFGTDNFEDPEYIEHPCYSHAGIAKAFKQFLEDKLAEARKEAIEECCKEIQETYGEEISTECIYRTKEAIHEYNLKIRQAKGIIRKLKKLTQDQ